MTEQAKRLRELTIMLINGRRKERSIERIYNFVIGIVQCDYEEKKRKDLSMRAQKKGEINERTH